ncbi:MarR family transcriptional regulator [Streptomyces sp. NPDC093990]|uniref:MarR family winged helix-turn-helix transcriptional regulator n=1 Tax=Streptomyces sp. NPDC093990 TaxID=3155306 RepID=UPI0034345898
MAALPVAGLSRSATRVLGEAARSAQTRPGDLTDRLQMTSSNIAAALRELEAAGLVFCERDEQDRRKVRVVLTPRGQDVVAQSRRERDSWLGRAVETVLDPEEQDLLLRAGNLLERVAGYEPPQP